jgi:hypothetical protein
LERAPTGIARRGTHFLTTANYLSAFVFSPIAIEMEKVKQVPDRGAIQRNIRIVAVHHRIRSVAQFAVGCVDEKRRRAYAPEGDAPQGLRLHCGFINSG